MKLIFDREFCERCGGSGRYPSSAWQGVCLGCSGQGRKLTRKGKKANAAWVTFLEATCQVPGADVTVGMRVRTRSGQRYRTVTAVTLREDGTNLVECGNNQFGGFATYERPFTADEMRAFVATQKSGVALEEAAPVVA